MLSKCQQNTEKIVELRVVDAVIRGIWKSLRHSSERITVVDEVDIAKAVAADK